MPTQTQRRSIKNHSGASESLQRDTILTRERTRQIAKEAERGNTKMTLGDIIKANSRIPNSDWTIVVREMRERWMRPQLVEDGENHKRTGLRS